MNDRFGSIAPFRPAARHFRSTAMNGYRQSAMQFAPTALFEYHLTPG
jgi:hypothetical protein